MTPVIFPDRTFRYTTGCDVCEELLTAKGTYRVKKGAVELVFDRSLPPPNELKGPLYVGRGQHAYIVAQSDLSAIKTNQFFARYLKQDEKFYDWKKIQDDVSRLKVKKQTGG